MRHAACILVLSVAACSPQEWVEKRLQEAGTSAEAKFAEEWIAKAARGALDQNDPHLDEVFGQQKSIDAMRQVAEWMPDGEPAEVKVVGYQIFRGSSGSRVTTSFQYRYLKPEEKLFAVQTVVQGEPRNLVLAGLHVNPLPKPLDELNAFRLTGVSFRHYLFLALTIAVPLFVLFTLIVCVRTRIPKRKWLWIVFTLLGIGKLELNWTTGAFATSYLAVQLFGIGAWKGGPYAPWILSFSVPVGAIVFLVRRRQWMRGAPVDSSIREALRQIGREPPARALEGPQEGEVR